MGKRSSFKIPATVDPPRLGVSSRLFRGSPAEVAGQVAGFGLESVQILPEFPAFPFESAADVTPQRARAIARPFREADLVVAAIASPVNFVDPDRARRRRQIERLDAVVDCCAEFESEAIVVDSGTLSANRPWEPHPDNHKSATLREFLRAIKPTVRRAESAGVRILIEGHLHHVVSSPAVALRVRESLGPALWFVMTPANFMTRTMAVSTRRPLRDLFTALGPHCPMAYAKDVRYVGSELTTPRAGSGVLDYREYLTLLGEWLPGAPLILDQTTPADLRETIEFLDDFYETPPLEPPKKKAKPRPASVREPVRARPAKKSGRAARR
jgi:sugar phosphate isomerase/epimerase